MHKTYSGPEGFAIAGIGTLVPGEEYEVDESLATHPWFGGEPEKTEIKLSELPKTHKELDAIAEQKGIEFPKDSIIATKQKLIKEAGA